PGAEAPVALRLPASGQGGAGLARHRQRVPLDRVLADSAGCHPSGPAQAAGVTDARDQLVTDHADAAARRPFLCPRRAHRAKASLISTFCSAWCFFVVPAEGAADSGRETRRSPRSAIVGTVLPARARR